MICGAELLYFKIGIALKISSECNVPNEIKSYFGTVRDAFNNYKLMFIETGNLSISTQKY